LPLIGACRKAKPICLNGLEPEATMTITLATLMMLCAPQVHPNTMRAIIQVESAGNPFAISINYPKALAAAGIELPRLGEQPRTAGIALRVAADLAASGFQTSVGLAQINVAHLQRYGLDVAQLLNPCTNLRVAQRLLIECDQLQDSLHRPGGRATRLQRTLSCYNSGNFFTGVENGYVAAIRQASLNPVDLKP
jgi:type IV secretion system protein VirB1